MQPGSMGTRWAQRDATATATAALSQLNCCSIKAPSPGLRRRRTAGLTSSTLPDVLSFQQKWMRESSVCWMYTSPFLLSGVTVLAFRDILPARNSTKYLLEEPREPGTRLGNKAPEDILEGEGKGH